MNNNNDDVGGKNTSSLQVHDQERSCIFFMEQEIFELYSDHLFYYSDN